MPVPKMMLYVYRVTIKWLCFLLFGIGTVFLVFILFPLMSLGLRPKARFQRRARPVVSGLMRFFVGLMGVLRVLKVELEDPQAYRGFGSKIVVANHPSLLDVVILISLIPNADCIVRGKLSRHIVGGVIRRLYISNALDFETLSAACMESLAQGNCIIIFPEGTRTPRSGELHLKKGAARLSLLSRHPIVPVHIGGTDKYGLGKGDPWWAVNPKEIYIYRLRIQRELFPEQYADLPVPIGVKHFNEDIKACIMGGSGGFF